MRNRAIIGYGLCFFLSILSGVTSARAQDKIRMGLSSVSGLHSATWIAEQRGFYRKYGIDAEIIVTGQGGTAGIGALLANDIQMVSSAGDLLAAAALRGGDTVMIAAVINKGLQRILTVPEIKTPADLKGKRVGVTRRCGVARRATNDAAALADEPQRRAGYPGRFIAQYAR